MKPFSCRNFNNHQCIFYCRLSRARQMVENAFRILANCFRCLLTTMAQELHNVKSVVMACVTLHHLIMTHYLADHQRLPNEDNNQRKVPGGWRQGQVLNDLGGPERDNNATIAAKRQREYLMHYYNNAVEAASSRVLMMFISGLLLFITEFMFIAIKY